MRTAHALLLVASIACTKAGPTEDSATRSSDPPVATPPGAKMPPPPTATVSKVKVVMTAATLADECGGAPTRLKGDDSASQKQTLCNQSSMQLSVAVPADGAATQITVKRVELFDDKGVLIGTLTPRMPTVWSQDGTYAAWDQNVAAGQELSVSYALSQPPWGNVTDRWSRTYVLKAVITIGGADRSVQRDVHVAQPTTLPPDVQT